MKVAAICALAAALALPALPQTLKTRPGNSPADALQRKLDTIRRNSAHAIRSPITTDLPEGEVNAWLASSYAQLPKGVRSLHLTGLDGRVTADAKVDFDEFTGGVGSNPLLAIFRGVHDVQVIATGHATGGEATLHTESVTLDGVTIPTMVLEFFVERYVQPRYPNVGIDSHFTPGYHVDSARVGAHVLTVVQK